MLRTVNLTLRADSASGPALSDGHVEALATSARLDGGTLILPSIMRWPFTAGTSVVPLRLPVTGTEASWAVRVRVSTLDRRVRLLRLVHVPPGDDPIDFDDLPEADPAALVPLT